MILCGRSARHLYVANRLCQACEPVAIVHERGGWNKKKLRKLFNIPAMWSKAWRWLRDRRRYTGNPEAKFFFGKEEPRVDRPELVREVDGINSPELVALADELAPDFIAVFGTSLIKSDLLTKGRLGIVNLHGGLSPEYRGADCTFWALYNGEPEKVGCTLHYIDAGIDTGKLIAHISPEVKPSDDELVLFWRAVQASADIYAEFLQRALSGEAFGEHQSHKGKLYQVKDRLLRHEQSLERRMAAGEIIREPLPQRVRWFQPS
jgi:methionyl-tRNA formyltransferase